MGFPVAALAGLPVSPAWPLRGGRECRSSHPVPIPRGSRLHRRRLARPAPAIDHRQRLTDHLIENLGHALLAGHQPDTLARHQRAVLDIAIDHRAAQRPGPEMLDFELRIFLTELASRKALDNRA